MRYLRMLSNSVFGGVLAAAYITVMMLHLNPTVSLTADALVPLATVLLVSYGLHITAALYAIYVLRQIAALEPWSPGWVSLRLLTWSAMGVSAAAALVAWLNARALRNTLEPSAMADMARAAFVFAVSSGMFLVLAVAHAAARRRARALLAALFVTTAVASVAVPLVLRGPGIERPLVRRTLDIGEVLPGATGDAPRAIVLLLDGASLDVISPAVAAGRLPNFGRLLDGGASMYLATVQPTQPEPVWVSVVTGKWPSRHGIRGAALYRAYSGGPALELLPDYLFSQALVRFGILVEEPHSSAELQVRPLWRILTGYGVPAGFIGLPLTHPAEPIQGFIVSDRYHRRLDPSVELDARPTVYPPDINESLPDVRRAGSPPPQPVVPAALTLLPQNGESASALVADRVHHELVNRVGNLRDVRLLAVRYAGLDAVGHYYLRYAAPQDFGDVSETERRQFGRVLEDYYAYVDGLVGEALANLRHDDLLLVISGFGMEPLTPGKRLLERLAGNAGFSGTHERAPDGFLLAYGSAVAPGRRSRGAIVDVTPSLLYFLGLPVARDMDGFVRTDAFTPAFNAQRTITFIPTYDR